MTWEQYAPRRTGAGNPTGQITIVASSPMARGRRAGKHNFEPGTTPDAKTGETASNRQEPQKQCFNDLRSKAPAIFEPATCWFPITATSPKSTDLATF